MADNPIRPDLDIPGQVTGDAEGGPFNVGDEPGVDTGSVGGAFSTGAIGGQIGPQGPEGPQGPMGITILEDHDSTLTYSNGRLVRDSNNISFQAIQDVPAGTLLTNELFWAPLADIDETVLANAIAAYLRDNPIQERAGTRFSATTGYLIGDIVSQNISGTERIFVSRQSNNTGNTPPNATFWQEITDNNTTYSFGWDVTSNQLRLTGSDSTTDGVTVSAGTNVTFDQESATGFRINAAGQDGNTTYDLTWDATNNQIQLAGSDSTTDPITISPGTDISFTAESATGFTINSTGGADSRLIVSDTEPTENLVDGTIWVNTTGTGTPTLNIYNGTAFGELSSRGVTHYTIPRDEVTTLVPGDFITIGATNTNVALRGNHYLYVGDVGGGTAGLATKTVLANDSITDSSLSSDQYVLTDLLGSGEATIPVPVRDNRLDYDLAADGSNLPGDGEFLFRTAGGAALGNDAAITQVGQVVINASDGEDDIIATIDESMVLVLSFGNNWVTYDISAVSFADTSSTFRTLAFSGLISSSGVTTVGDLAGAGGQLSFTYTRRDAVPTYSPVVTYSVGDFITVSLPAGALRLDGVHNLTAIPTERSTFLFQALVETTANPLEVRTGGTAGDGSHRVHADWAFTPNSNTPFSVDGQYSAGSFLFTAIDASSGDNFSNDERVTLWTANQNITRARHEDPANAGQLLPPALPTNGESKAGYRANGFTLLGELPSVNESRELFNLFNVAGTLHNNSTWSNDFEYYAAALVIHDGDLWRIPNNVTGVVTGSNTEPGTTGGQVWQRIGDSISTIPTPEEILDQLSVEEYIISRTSGAFNVIRFTDMDNDEFRWDNGRVNIIVPTGFNGAALGQHWASYSTTDPATDTTVPVAVIRVDNFFTLSSGATSIFGTPVDTVVNSTAAFDAADVDGSGRIAGSELNGFGGSGGGFFLVTTGHSGGVVNVDTDGDVELLPYPAGAVPGLWGDLARIATGSGSPDTVSTANAAEFDLFIDTAPTANNIATFDLYFSDGTDWHLAGSRVAVQGTSPATDRNLANQEITFVTNDTGDVVEELWVWNGSAWIQADLGGGSTTTYAASPPTGNTVSRGDLWVQTSTRILYIVNDSGFWVPVAPQGFSDQTGTVPSGTNVNVQRFDVTTGDESTLSTLAEPGTSHFTNTADNRVWVYTDGSVWTEVSGSGGGGTTIDLRNLGGTTSLDRADVLIANRAAVPGANNAIFGDTVTITDYTGGFDITSLTNTYVAQGGYYIFDGNLYLRTGATLGVYNTNTAGNPPLDSSGALNAGWVRTQTTPAASTTIEVHSDFPQNTLDSIGTITAVNTGGGTTTISVADVTGVTALGTVLIEDASGRQIEYATVASVNAGNNTFTLNRTPAIAVTAGDQVFVPSLPVIPQHTTFTLEVNVDGLNPDLTDVQVSISGLTAVDNVNGDPLGNITLLNGLNRYQFQLSTTQYNALLLSATHLTIVLESASGPTSAFPTNGVYTPLEVVADAGIYIEDHATPLGKALTIDLEGRAVSATAVGGTATLDIRDPQADANAAAITALDNRLTNLLNRADVNIENISMYRLWKNTLPQRNTTEVRRRTASRFPNVSTADATTAGFGWDANQTIVIEPDDLGGGLVGNSLHEQVMNTLLNESTGDRSRPLGLITYGANELPGHVVLYERAFANQTHVMRLAQTGRGQLSNVEIDLAAATTFKRTNVPIGPADADLDANGNITANFEIYDNAGARLTAQETGARYDRALGLLTLGAEVPHTNPLWLRFRADTALVGTNYTAADLIRRDVMTMLDNTISDAPQVIQDIAVPDRTTLRNRNWRQRFPYPETVTMSGVTIAYATVGTAVNYDNESVAVQSLLGTTVGPFGTVIATGGQTSSTAGTQSRFDQNTYAADPDANFNQLQGVARVWSSAAEVAAIEAGLRGLVTNPMQDGTGTIVGDGNITAHHTDETAQFVTPARSDNIDLTARFSYIPTGETEAIVLPGVVNRQIDFYPAQAYQDGVGLWRRVQQGSGLIQFNITGLHFLDIRVQGAPVNQHLEPGVDTVAITEAPLVRLSINPFNDYTESNEPDATNNTPQWSAENVITWGSAGTPAAGDRLTVNGNRIEFDYTDPEALFELSKQTPNKSFNRIGETLVSISFTLPNADGTTGVNQYFQEFSRTGDVLNSIRLYEGSDNTGTLRATKTFNRDGQNVLTGITIT